MYRLKGPNNVLYCDVGFCVVKNILSQNSHVVLIVQKFKIVEDVFTYPCKSSGVGIAFVSDLSDTFDAIHIREATKCWCVEFDESRTYIVKLLHESR